jgi:hypothetical protein
VAFTTFSFGDELSVLPAQILLYVVAKMHKSKINHSLQVRFEGENVDKFNIISVQISVAVG